MNRQIRDEIAIFFYGGAIGMGITTIGAALLDRPAITIAIEYVLAIVFLVTAGFLSKQKIK